MLSWRFLQQGAGSAARNMAIDEALLREVREPILRLYSWNEPVVSLGYFQSIKLAGPRSFVRRYTGGGLVDHAHDVTYTIVLPRAHPWMSLPLSQCYAIIHQGVQAVLAVAGLESELASQPSSAISEACFQKPVRHDLMVGEKKVSGAAQRRTREGLLHQGSILLPDPAQNEAVRTNFARGFFDYYEFNWTKSELTSAEIASASDLERSRYATEAWNHWKTD
jgi:lipoate-protein ligase A